MRSTCGFSLFAIFSLAFSASAFAQSQTFASKQCNGCSSQQRETTAIGQGGVNGTMRYVHDLSSGTLYKYKIEREPIVGGYAYYAMPQPVEPAYQDVTTKLKGLWDANGHRFTYRATAAASGSAPTSAFDVADPGAGRNNAISWIKEPSNWSVYNQIIFHYQTIIGAGYRMVQGTPVTITFEVTFPDGSRADFMYSYPEQVVTYVDKSAIDSMGNPIPQGPSDIDRNPHGGGTNYDFRNPGDDIGRALQRFSAYGVPIQSGYRYACTNDPEYGVRCQRIYAP